MAKKKSKIEDRHHQHLCYPKADWNKGYAKSLREHWYLVVYIPKLTLHRYIHCGVMAIPAPSGSAAKAVLDRLSELDNSGALSKTDTAAHRLELLIRLFDFTDANVADALRRQLQIVRAFYAW